MAAAAATVRFRKTIASSHCVKLYDMMGELGLCRVMCGVHLSSSPHFAHKNKPAERLKHAAANGHYSGPLNMTNGGVAPIESHSLHAILQHAAVRQHGGA